MNYIEYDDFFDHIKGDTSSYVFLVFPKVFGDERGSFTEVLKNHNQWPKDNMPIWFTDTNWIRQINRSTSIPNVCRGMHALRGIFCQSKLVECIYGSIHDIILDARPNSKSFGKVKAYELNSDAANKLFVPKGFLHGFYSDCLTKDGKQIEKNIFQYYIGGGTYNHESEFSVSISDVIELLKKDIANYWISTDDIILSDKDKVGVPVEKWLSDTMFNYNVTLKLWYK